MTQPDDIYAGQPRPMWLDDLARYERRRRRLKLLGTIALAAGLAASIGASLLMCVAP